MNVPKLYFVTGISGSGKTTIGRELIRRGEVAFDSKITKGIFHFVDKQGNKPKKQLLHDKKWMQRYKWSLNKQMLDALMRQHSGDSRVFLCGRGNIRQYWELADKVFLLRVTANTLLHRLNAESRDNQFAQDEVTQKRLVSELDGLQNNLLAAGAIEIDAEQPINIVTSEILKRVK